MAEHSLNRANSLALVQIFLNASLACIAHTRELIPWTSPCFRTRYIDQIWPALDTEEEDLYKAFQGLDATDTSHGQEIRILIRGGHSKADQLLDMLVAIQCFKMLVSLTDCRCRKMESSKLFNTGIWTHFRSLSQRPPNLLSFSKPTLSSSHIRMVKSAASN